jgi:signal transduction histidine kinase
MLALMLIALLAVWVAQSREAYLQRVEELEQTREQLRQFMGLVVHDLRNPLGVALGYVQFARRKLAGIPADTVEGSLASAEKSLHTMEHLLSDLLDAVRLGNNRFQIHPAPFDLAALVRSAVDDQGRIYPRHKIVLDSPDHVEVAGDEDRIRQVVVNLISNACKYSAEETEVGVRVRAQADTVTLTVEDDGRGIAPADLGEIFQPFARLAIDRAVPGVGLGLYITKGIVEAHGGTITVSSIIGQGSVFIVTLPQHNVGLLASSTDVASPSRETYKRQ